MYKLYEAYSDFMTEYDNRGTLKYFRRCLGELFQFFDREVDVGTLTKRDMKRFQQHLQRQVRTGRWNERTYNSMLRGIRRFFAWLEELEEVESNLAKVIRPMAVPERFDEDRVMSDEDYEKLIEAAAQNIPFYAVRDTALLMLIGESGARSVDASSITVDDLDLDRCTASVIGKGDRQRRIWFSANAADALAKFLEVRLEFVRTNNYKTRQLFISTRNDRGLNSDNIQAIMRRTCVRADIQVRGTHSLRYRLMKKLRDAGIDQRTRMMILGHRSVDVHIGYLPAETAYAAETVQHVNRPARPSPSSFQQPNIVAFDPLRQKRIR